MGVIQLLSDHTIEKIAAGEIIERPASVVKELIENAIDAGCRNITVRIRGGGKEYISVADTGTGMDREDVAMAFERHATSKIKDIKDFDALQTLGFRGEALASISAVSRLTLTSSLRNADTGSSIFLEGGKVKWLKDASPVEGTIVEVKHLFYNLPARRKYLKSAEIEFRHISDTVIRYALAFPDISFSLAHDVRQTLHAPPVTQLKERIFQLFGSQALDHLLLLSLAQEGVKMEGYISDHTLSRSGRTRYFVFINGRAVQEPLIDRAVREAYSGILDTPRYPVIFLYLTMDPSEVDVNVHPAKKRVRFFRSAWMFRFIRDGIKNCYARFAPIPSITSSPLSPEGRGAALAKTGPLHGSEGEPSVLPGMENGGGLITGETRPFYTDGMGRETETFQVREVRLPLTGQIHPIGQYRRCYIVAENPAGLLLIDQHVAHERVLFEQLRRAQQEKKVERQLLVQPLSVPLSPSLVHLAETRLDHLKMIGLDAEIFGRDALLVTALPAVLAPDALEPLVSDVLELLADESGEGMSAAGMEKMLIRVACHGAIKVNQTLTMDKMRYLIESLFKTEEPYYCPHGRPIIFVIKHDFIQKRFKRE